MTVWYGFTNKYKMVQNPDINTNDRKLHANNGFSLVIGPWASVVLVIASLRCIPVRSARWCHQPPQPASSARRRCTRSARCQRAAHLHVESARRPFPAGLVVGLWVFCGSVGGCGLELPPVALCARRRRAFTIKE